MPSTATTYSRADVDRAGDHALDDAGVVAQVDEGQVLAVLAALRHPAAHGHRGAHVGEPAASRTGRVRIEVAPSTSGLGGNGHAGPFGRPRRGPWSAGARVTGRGGPGHRTGSAARTAPRPPSARGTVRWSPSPRRGRSDTVPDGSLVRTHDERPPGPGAVRRLELGLHRPVVEGPVGRQPGRAQRGGEVPGGVAPGRCRPRRRRAGSGSTGNTPSASQASRIRSMPDAEADARGGRPAEHLHQAVVAAAATDPVLGRLQGARRRTRTWSGCSSRSPAPGGGRAV